MSLTVLNTSIVDGEKLFRAIEIGNVFEIIQSKDHYRMTYVRPGDVEASEVTLFGNIKVLNDQGVILADQKLDTPGLGLVTRPVEVNRYADLGFGFYLTCSGQFSVYHSDVRESGYLQIYQDIPNSNYYRKMADLPVTCFFTPLWDASRIGISSHMDLQRMLSEISHYHDNNAILFEFVNDGTVRHRKVWSIDRSDIEILLANKSVVLFAAVTFNNLHKAKLENWDSKEYVNDH